MYSPQKISLDFNQPVTNQASDLFPFPDYEWQGVDTSRKVSNTKSTPWRWICSLQVSFPKPVFKTTIPPTGTPKTALFGTGVLIGPRYVLTVAHNVLGLDHKNRRVLAQQIKVAPGRHDDKYISRPFGTFYHRNIYYMPQFYRLADTYKAAAFDLALIELSRSPGNRKKLGWWGRDSGSYLKAVTPSYRSQLKTRKVNVAGYPYAKDPDAFTDRSTPAGLPYHDFDGIRNLYPNMLTYNAWADKGMSGGPVWIYDKQLGNRYLVGVHQGKGLFENGKCQGVLLRPEFIAWLRKKTGNSISWS